MANLMNRQRTDIKFVPPTRSFIHKMKEYNFMLVRHDISQENINNVFDVWKQKFKHLEKLDLILSVTGGARDFSFSSSIKTSFKEGIAKLAMSTNALIVTGGTCVGVMKLVGEAISLKSDAPKEPKLKLLGVAPLERVDYHNPNGQVFKKFLSSLDSNKFLRTPEDMLDNQKDDFRVIFFIFILLLFYYIYY
jgi:hypothetical protein